jgi:peptidoglycan/LPS O-acetylase OafA/YrhL
VDGAALPERGRLDFLDAARAFALVLGVVFHACLSFVPVYLGWAVQDVSTSPWVSGFSTISHSFRMELFFLIAGFFGRRTYHRQGVAAFLRTRWVRLGVPFVVGWFLLRPLLVSGWILGGTSMRGEVDIPAALWGGLLSLRTLPAGIFTGSHLWFLYYLLLVTLFTVALRGLMTTRLFRAVPWWRWGDAVAAWSVRCPWAPLVLALPTAMALLGMRSWGMDTPDQSLFPHLPVLAVYGGCFVLGWFLGRREGALDDLARGDWRRWVQAVIGAAAILGLAGVEADPAHRWYGAVRVAYAFGYGMTLWSLVFLTLGFFRRTFPTPNTAVRYVADASYWIYLVHLPLVVWLQVAVAEWPIHWSYKLALVSGVTLGMALLSYDLLVRSTFLGGLLNGRRRERVLLSALSRLWRRES